MYHTDETRKTQFIYFKTLFNHFFVLLNTQLKISLNPINEKITFFILLIGLFSTQMGCELFTEKIIIDDGRNIRFIFEDGLNEDVRFKLPKDENGYYYMELKMQDRISKAFQFGCWMVIMMFTVSVVEGDMESPSGQWVHCFIKPSEIQKKVQSIKAILK